MPKCLEMPKASGTCSPKDLMAKAGIGITNTNFWQSELGKLADYMESARAEDLAQQVGQKESLPNS